MLPQDSSTRIPQDELPGCDHTPAVQGLLSDEDVVVSALEDTPPHALQTTV